MAESYNEFEDRKREHIRFAMDSSAQGLVQTSFSKIKLIHQALPEINYSDVSLKVKLLGHEVLSPHFVSSMTAGHQDSLKINRNLAVAAAENGWLMGVGSQRRELTDPEAATEWREILSTVPDLKLISNIGILEVLTQSPEKIMELVVHLNAIGLYIHLNPLQEVFQNSSNLSFAGALAGIEKLVKQSHVPILVKEVGFGINKDISDALFDVGVKAVDVSGHGGTHWAKIEALRQSEDSIIYNSADAFADWGYSTVDCLLDLQDQVLFHQIWASGGIRNGVESAKCMALGARAVGIAQPLMKAALVGAKEVSHAMKEFDFQLKTALFCMGIKRCEELLHKKVWYVPVG
jgi:isopentenyl-diphosphate delta-isomerase